MSYIYICIPTGLTPTTCALPYVWWFNYNIKLPFNTDIRLMINNFFLNAKAYSTFAAQFLLGNVPSNRKCDSALFNRVGVPPGFGDWSVRLLTHVVYFILCYSAAKHEVRRLYLLNLRFYFFSIKLEGSHCSCFSFRVIVQNLCWCWSTSAILFSKLNERLVQFTRYTCYRTFPLCFLVCCVCFV